MTVSRLGTVSIARAAQVLARSYNQVLRLVLLGHIKGWQTASGRWVVDAESVHRFGSQSGRSMAIPDPGLQSYGRQR